MGAKTENKTEIKPEIKTEITLGPVLFNWPPERWRDFYFRIADEAPLSIVYVGEVVCSKRAPLYEEQRQAAVERLSAAGKIVVFSTLSEVVLKLDRLQVQSVCALPDALVEVNDSSALYHMRGRPHHIGPFMNVYNEETLDVLSQKGARNICLPVEIPATAIRALAARAKTRNVTIEAQVFGRLPLALSARCYHARAHGRTKDSCQFVCENDLDGMELHTMDGRAFLAVNGIQTLSYDYLNLINELPHMQEIGISRFRLSPHSCDMVRVASIFRSAVDEAISLDEASARLEELKLPAPFSNGFFHGKRGYSWNTPRVSAV